MDLMAARRRLMEMQELPSAYRRVEYLESSGTQYILTPLTYVYGYQIRIKIVNATLPPSQAFGYLGIWTTTAHNNVQSYFAINSVIITRGTDSAVYDLGFPVDGVIIVDGKDIRFGNLTYAGNAIPPDEQIKFTLFGYNRSGGNVNCLGSSRIYYARFYDSNHNYTGNFIPCVRKADSKPGMYDTVSKMFYTNAGTGEFIIPS